MDAKLKREWIENRAIYRAGGMERWKTLEDVDIYNHRKYAEVDLDWFESLLDAEVERAKREVADDIIRKVEDWQHLSFYQFMDKYPTFPKEWTGTYSALLNWLSSEYLSPKQEAK